MWGYLKRYAPSVGRHWLAWFSGSAVLGILGLALNAMSNVHLPAWFWILVVAGGGFVAQFKAWLDVVRERDKLAAELDAPGLVLMPEVTHVPPEEPPPAASTAVAEVMAALPHPRDMDTLVCVGWRADGSFYFNCSADDGGEVLWLIETLRNELMNKASPSMPQKPRG